jgi:hypothetical protein
LANTEKTNPIAGRGLLTASALLVLVASVACSHAPWAKRARMRRESRYQATLQSYSEDLKPGMSRETVEDYLRAKTITFYRASSFYQKQSDQTTAYTDVTKIGKESAPYFFCSDTGIYVAFAFRPKEPRNLYMADASDLLDHLELLRWAKCKDFQVLVDDSPKH